MTKIPDAAFAHHTIVLGKTRSGKSSTMRGFVERLLQQKKPVGIIDPKGDWWGLKSSADGTKPGFKVVIFGGDHADVPIDEHSGKHVAELVATGNRPFIIDLGGWMVGARTRFFIDFASTLFRLTKGPRWLVIDEVHNFAPQGKVYDPDAGKMLHWSNRLASEGAGKGITLISASQRPQKVHKDYVTSHETLIAMRVIHPLDRGAAKDWLDGAPDPGIGKEVLDSLATLERGEGWVWCPEEKFGPVRLKFPMFKTYDSFAAPTSESTAALQGWASVDLDDVRAKLADVVEKTKANDPRELQAQIGQLKTKIAQLEKVPAAGGAELDRARADNAALVARIETLDGHLLHEKAATAHWQGVVRDLGTRAAEALKSSAIPIAAPAPPTVARVPAAAPRPAPAPAPPRAALSANPVDAGDGDFTMTPARQQIVDKIAWAAVFFDKPAVARQVLGFLTGKHPRTKSVLNDLGALRTAGLVDYIVGGQLMLTDAGARHAAAVGTPRHDELIAGVKGALSKRQGEILDLALQAQAARSLISRKEIADYFDMHVRTKSFLNDLGKLKTFGVIIYTKVGGEPAIGAADFLRER